MPTVLITRPQASSELLAQELQEHGYNGVIEPLISIVSTPTPMPEVPDIQAVMITSANAITTLENDAYKVEAILNLPCFCVGERTAEQAELFGFQNIHNANGDGTALAKLVASSLSDKTKPILYICGQDTDSKAEDELQDLGYTIEPWSIYAAVTSKMLSTYAFKLLKEQKIDAVLVFSARTAETLNGLLKQHMLLTACAKMTAIGISESVAKILRPLPWRTFAATEPNQDSLIACLKQNCPLT